MAKNCQYDGAPSWDGGRHCSGRFLSGTEALGNYLKGRYGGSYGGYSCRPNSADPSEQSVHGTGRAIDFFPDNKAEGDAIAALCVANHIAWGIQLVIWWRRDWQCHQGWTAYTGPHPHTDHLHIELTIPAATTNTAATYAGRKKEDLTIMDKATRNYLDAQFAGIRKRQDGARNAIARARETQLAQGKVQKTTLTTVRALAVGQKATKEQLAVIDNEIEGIDAELDEIAADIGALHSELAADEV